MTHIIVVFSLVLSAANWLVFLAAAVLENLPAIRLALEPRSGRVPSETVGAAGRSLQADKVIDATGTLATSLRRAGPAASAAAMSLACLLVALTAGALDKL
ncbi:hypothetical protein [Sphingomonas sp. GC_Shp_3]|jgi:hypothetical protein|uniref:hypothetical protein n=1 Tax=Sphingomonas sp. GC_Shp_3 TaxID=2937383 RepID=UPI00226A9D36|nr:hypothetical protein [Sphingomonas sp. GC_Shp_3]